jgi:uroporphyrinogen-III synthase
VQPRAAQLAQRLQWLVTKSPSQALHVLPFSLEQIEPTNLDSFPAQAQQDPRILWLCVSPSASGLWTAHASPHVPVCGIGPGSQEVLVDAGHQVLVLAHDNAKEYDADSFVEALIQHNIHQVRAGREPITQLNVIKGYTGRTDWFERLQVHGVLVTAKPVYLRKPSAPNAHSAEQMLACASNNVPACLVLPSAAAIDGICAWAATILVDFDLRAWILRQQVLVPHSRLEAFARSKGFIYVSSFLPGTKALAQAVSVALQLRRG